MHRRACRTHAVCLFVHRRKYWLRYVGAVVSYAHTVSGLSCRLLKCAPLKALVEIRGVVVSYAHTVSGLSCRLLKCVP